MECSLYTFFKMNNSYPSSFSTTLNIAIVINNVMENVHCFIVKMYRDDIHFKTAQYCHHISM